MINKGIAIGADIGGSHISSAGIDLSARSILKSSFSDEDVDNKASGDKIIAAWANALKNTLQKIDSHRLAGIGFAMPGPFNYETGVALFERVEKYESLYGLDVGEALKEVLGLSTDLPVRFMNDATAFAVGEAWAGKASGSDRALAVTLGTGFGSAFLEKGVPVVNGNNVPEMGCAWHLPFQDGIADDYISTRWFINSYKEVAGGDISGVKELAEKAVADRNAESLFQQFGENLGVILAPWIDRFKVEVMVIGGNISYAYNLFGPYMELEFEKNNWKIKVEISELREDAAILGSARLLEEDFWLRVKDLLKLM